MSSPNNDRRFAPNRTGYQSPLGQLEQLVMVVLWRGGTGDAMSVADVHAALPQEPPAAYTTVKTTMERLAEKGILVQERSGKAYLYRAALSEEELERRIVAATLDNLVERFPQAVASFFVRPDPAVTETKLDLLRDAIKQRRHREKGDTPDA